MKINAQKNFQLLKLNILSFQCYHSKQTTYTDKSTWPTNKLQYMNIHTHNTLKVNVNFLERQKKITTLNNYDSRLC